MAVDGDPSTAWVVGDRGDPIGESIAVSSTDGELILLQPQGTVPTRRISRVRVEAGDRAPVAIELGDASTTGPGQRIDVPADVPVTVTIDAVVDVAGSDSGPTAVGFAELGPVAREVVHVPSDAWVADRRRDAVGDRAHPRPHRPANRWRSDPEPRLVRDLELPAARDVTASVTLRLDARAADELVALWSGRTGTAVADRRLTGIPRRRRGCGARRRRAARRGRRRSGRRSGRRWRCRSTR